MPQGVGGQFGGDRGEATIEGVLDIVAETTGQVAGNGRLALLFGSRPPHSANELRKDLTNGGDHDT